VDAIQLAAEEVELAQKLGAATHEKYKGNLGHYRNLPRSHLVGKLGEMAVDKWLQSEGFDPDAAYKDPEREGEPDLIVAGNGLEVKTWRAETWPDWGRCVTPYQLKGIEKRAVAIVWVIVDDEREPVPAELPGWSTPQDAPGVETRMTGPESRQVLNHQVEPDALRDLESLTALLRA
jgi:hypothetical protein